MPQKTWKAAKKRIQITKKKKILKKRAGQNHFNTKERSSTKLHKKRKMTAPKAVNNIVNMI